MRKKVKRIDLRRENPGPRAFVELPQEDFEFSGELPIVGGKVTMKGRVTSGSSLSSTLTTVALIGAGCACAITLHIIGTPVWLAALSLLLPSGLFTLSRSRKLG
jgi:hypothetical protein